MFSFLLRALFPRFCAGCSREGTLLCHSCKRDWNDAPVHIADKRHVFAFAYANVTARLLVCAWKYAYDISAWSILQKKMIALVPVLQSFVRVTGIEAVSYVPLHPVKRCERGFDQAQELARWVSEQTGLPLVVALTRTRFTKSQAHQTTQERKQMLKRSTFVVAPGKQSFRRILLVDDVWTTGSTMKSAARVLKKAGARTWFFTLAKG